MGIGLDRGAQHLCAAVFCLLLCSVPAGAENADERTERVESLTDIATEDIQEELDNKRETIGWAEKVLIYPSRVLMQAKFVPGDESSSIHATRIKKFRKNGRDWVRFTLRDIRGENYTLESEVLRSVNIRGKKGSAVRYLVHLGICIGTEYGEAELRLTNRARRDHKILLGRNILAGKFLLDPARSYMSKPKCSDSLISSHQREKKSKKADRPPTAKKPNAKRDSASEADRK